MRVASSKIEFNSCKPSGEFRVIYNNYANLNAAADVCFDTINRYIREKFTEEFIITKSSSQSQSYM